MPTSALKGSIWDFSNFSEDELKLRLSDRKEEVDAIEEELLKRKTDDIVDKVDQLRQLWTEISAAGVKIIVESMYQDESQDLELNALSPYSDVVFDISNIRR